MKKKSKSKSSRSLEEVVDKETYSVWVDIRRLGCDDETSMTKNFAT